MVFRGERERGFQFFKKWKEMESNGATFPGSATSITKNHNVTK